MYMILFVEGIRTFIQIPLTLKLQTLTAVGLTLLIVMDSRYRSVVEELTNGMITETVIILLVGHGKQEAQHPPTLMVLLPVQSVRILRLVLVY